MLLFSMLPVLLAKTEWYQSVGFKWVIVLAVIAACYALGMALGRALRMADYGWKIGVILAVLGVAPVLIWARWPPNLGVDLNGGMILIYEIDKDATLASNNPDEDGTGAAGASSRRSRREAKGSGMTGVNVSGLISQIARRINPGGTLEIKVRQYGERQIEIIIPETDPEEVGRIKRLVEKAGVLEFLIVADRPRDDDLIDLANTPAEHDQMFVKRNRGKEGEKTIGRWVKVGRELTPVDGVFPLKVPVMYRTIRDARTKDWITVPSTVMSQKDEKGSLFAKWLEEKGHEAVEVLMVYDDRVYISGNDLDLSGVQSSFDEETNPCVNFRMTPLGGTRMARLTSENVPDPNTRSERSLGIVLDEELLSAPNIKSVISEEGRITGKFTIKEVQELVDVLKGGSLSAVLIKEPVSENPIGPELGADTIRKGALSSGIALVCVLIFMMIYYRFSGVVAVWTLLINLLLMLAIMVLFHATFTLSGIAGIVLTMGMAVDANVLIFERIREELARGAALRMALRNGFSRASTTIIDSNLTTLITAVVLYVIGTDQIRGFAVTLILGIVLSMFAAIFCARVVFDICERKRWITKLTMIKLMTETKINFMGIWQPTTIASLVIIAAGLIGVFLRGPELLGIDFTGGTAVHLMLREPMPVDEVRSKLNTAFEKASKEAGKTLQFNLVNVPVEGQRAETVYKVDSTLPDVDDLKQVIASEFLKPDGKESLLVQNKISFDPKTFKTEVIDVSSAETPPTKPATNGADFVPSTEGPKKTPAIGPSPEPEKTAPEKTEPEKKEPEAKEPEKKESEAKSPEKTDSAKPDSESKEPAEKKPVDTQPESTEPNKTDGAALPLNDDTQLVSAVDARLFVAQEEPVDPAAGKKAEKTEDPAKPAVTETKKEDETKPEGEEKPAAKTPAAESEPSTEAPKSPATGGELPTKEVAPERRFVTEGVLTFDQAISRDALRSEIIEIASKQGITLLETNVQLRTADPAKDGDGEIKGVTKRKSWSVRLAANETEAQKILEALQADVGEKVHWPSWNKIGGAIADKMTRVAIFALLASCLGIIAYIWFRFEKLMYGLAAVAAVVHDVLVMLAAIALSHWLYRVLGIVGVEDFKINLIEVAAFLTIIGYSLNDTIVIFDRIREIKGKSPNINRDMINQSVNQTLSRTMLTSITTLIVVLILYIFGGQGVHGFAFALLIGILSGTYSTVFIAAPLLLWMSRFGKSAKAQTKAAA